MADLPALLFALVVLAAVIVYIASPLFRGPRRDERTSTGGALSDVLRRRAELLAERSAIFGAMRDLDLEYKTDKVSEEDYRTQRFQLVARGVRVLEQLDRLPALEETPEFDPIEAAVAAARRGAAAPAAQAPASAPGARFCPQCGSAVGAQDRFCGVCGTPLSAEA